jgi:hypothetical protein
VVAEVAAEETAAQEQQVRGLMVDQQELYRSAEAAEQAEAVVVVETKSVATAAAEQL